MHEKINISQSEEKIYVNTYFKYNTDLVFYGPQITVEHAIGIDISASDRDNYLYWFLKEKPIFVPPEWKDEPDPTLTEWQCFIPTNLLTATIGNTAYPRYGMLLLPKGQLVDYGKGIAGKTTYTVATPQIKKRNTAPIGTSPTVLHHGKSGERTGEQHPIRIEISR